MSQMFAGKLIVIAISAVFALWDLRFRKAPLWLFAATFLAGCVFAAVTGRTVREVLPAAIPGGILLLLSVLTESGIGTGDGLFFIAVAGFLSPLESFLSLITAILLASLTALFLYVMKGDRKASIPFLFLVPPSLALLLFGGSL